MYNVNIQTSASLEVLKNLEEILKAIDPNTSMSYEGEDYELSKEDQEKLKIALDEVKSGKAKMVSWEEFEKRDREHSKSLGANL